jgi:hypothetical protein
MKRLIYLIVILLSGFFSVSSQVIFKEPLSSRQTYYKIDARLDVTEKIVDGEMVTYWVNKSSDIVTDVQLHLYLNAFSSSKSTFLKDRPGLLGGKESDLGWIDLISVSDRKGRDMIPVMEFISPDDGNPDDKTVLKIILHESAQPGDTVYLNISFKSKLPSIIIRTGAKDDYFFVAQWFPKFGVYEPAGMRFAFKGGWNCHQFHSTSEFYSNHSVYDVTITVPKEYIVGSGGMLIKESEADGGKKIMVYRAEDLVDFAWTAWPGYSVFTDEWKHIKITLLLPKFRENQVERQFKAVKNALEYMEKRIGPFPYPHLTFVDPPTKDSGAGGMEYTTLFTSASSFIMPESVHMPEMVTIHEFGHGYFMGILASNEFEEPWLDEGVNTFWESRIMDHYYGKNASLIDLPYLKFSDVSMSRSSYVTSGGKQVTSNNEYSWNYPHGTYGMMSYNKAAAWLNTLMGIVGEETIDEVFSEYYKRWAFKHPSGKDFVNVVNDVVTRRHGDKFGTDMNWFFNQTLYGTGICDYKVSGFSNDRITKSVGRPEVSDSLKTELSGKDSLYNSVAMVERIGEIMLPVEILVHFNDSSAVLENWDGKARYKDFTYTGTRKIDWVKIDPDYKITMDINFVNNSMTDAPNRVPVKRITGKLMTFLQFLISISSL